MSEDPHFYLLIDEQKESEYFNGIVEKHLGIINLKIIINTLNGSAYQTYLIKKVYFSNSNSIFVAEDWYESFIKYHFPKYAISKTILENKQESKFIFYFSKSELLTSKMIVDKKHTGEIQRKAISKISITKEVLHLGIKSITTDKYIGKQENVLEIIPSNEVTSLISFYKNIKPIIDLVLLLTSFAERRRLNWYKSEGSIGLNYVEIYNTRKTFYQDEETTLLISRFKFEDFLKNSLKNIKLKNVKYISTLLQSYFSGFKYSINGKITLWNSILEKILKEKFGKKKDSLKEELIKEIGVIISDLSPIKELIDIRNNIAHGDDIKSDKLFKLYEDWQILIDRILLYELKWFNLSATDVGTNDIKPYGL